MAEIKPALTNVRGPAARIVSVTSETLPAGAEATVEMTGPDQGRMFTFGLPAGMPAAEAVPQDEAVGGFIGTPGTDSRAATDARVEYALARTTAPVVRIEDGVDGVVGGTTVDNTAVIQNKFAQAGRGGTIVFGNPGLARTFRVDSTIQITDRQQRVIGGGADFYSSSLWTNQPITMMEVRADGVILDQVSLRSDFDRATTAVIGVKFFGSTTADVDSHVLRCCFYQLDRAVEMHGKNLRVENSLISNCGSGIYMGGQASGYHTTFESRGLIALSNRFHAVGANNTEAGVLLSPDAKHSMVDIKNNYFDMFGLGRHIAVIGADTANRHEAININGNSHFQTMDAAVYLDNVTRSKVSNALIYGGASGMTNAAVTIRNSLQIDASDLQIIRHNDGMLVENVNFVALRDITTANHSQNGIRFGATAANVLLDGIMAHSSIGWGLTGSAALPTPRQGFVSAFSNTAGQINPVLGLV